MRRELLFVILLGIILFTVPIISMQIRLLGMQMYSYPMTEYAAGWEVVSGIYGIQVSSSGIPSEVRSKVWTAADAKDFTEGTIPGFGVWQGVDVDGQAYALCPDINIVVDQTPKHVDESGERIPDDQPVKTFEKRIGDHYYVYDLHLFQFGIDISTTADVDGPYWAFGQSFWYHEIGSRFGENLMYSNLPGLPWEGSVFISFSIRPWIYHYDLINKTITIDGETYHLLYDEDEPVIAAVMLVEVVKASPRTVTDTQQLELQGYDFKASYGVPNYPPEGTDLNMYLPDTLTEYSDQDPNTLTPDQVARLKSSIVFSIPLKMIVGAYVATTWYGAYKAIEPVNVGIHITVRVEVLTVHNFVLHTSPTAEEVEQQMEYMNYTPAEQPLSSAPCWSRSSFRCRRRYAEYSSPC
ncbi:MAG: hypothetical protein B6D63_01710 [Candidatus Latescibacteria bacterium 4484_7]|nr:MAG: hypothetical protein B6D63_01710 [Candidatus Latescibacteria bacterium 4484_7]